MNSHAICDIRSQEVAKLIIPHPTQGVVVTIRLMEKIDIRMYVC